MSERALVDPAEPAHECDDCTARYYSRLVACQCCALTARRWSADD